MNVREWRFGLTDPNANHNILTIDGLMRTVQDAAAIAIVAPVVALGIKEAVVAINRKIKTRRIAGQRA